MVVKHPCSCQSRFISSQTREAFYRRSKQLVDASSWCTKAAFRASPSSPLRSQRVDKFTSLEKHNYRCRCDSRDREAAICYAATVTILCARTSFRTHSFSKRQAPSKEAKKREKQTTFRMYSAARSMNVIGAESLNTNCGSRIPVLSAVMHWIDRSDDPLTTAQTLNKYTPRSQNYHSIFHGERMTSSLSSRRNYF